MIVESCGGGAPPRRERKDEWEESVQHEARIPHGPQPWRGAAASRGETRSVVAQRAQALLPASLEERAQALECGAHLVE